MTTPTQLTFTVVVEDRAFAHMDETPALPGDDARRRYVTTLVQRRLHQQAFRERVLLAYHETCGICRLHQRELLDAAHISRVAKTINRTAILLPNVMRCSVRRARSGAAR